MTAYQPLSNAACACDVFPYSPWVAWEVMLATPRYRLLDCMFCAAHSATVKREIVATHLVGLSEFAQVFFFIKVSTLYSSGERELISHCLNFAIFSPSRISQKLTYRN